MVGSATRKMKESDTKKRKRRLEASGDDPPRSAKSVRAEDASCSKESGVVQVDAMKSTLHWRNLDLLLSVQSKDLPARKKIELVHDFVKSGENDDAEEGLQTVNAPRLVVHMINWVQSVLISSEKEMRHKEEYLLLEELPLHLDCRCWDIFRFFLQESLKLCVPLSLSRDILRVISSVVRSMTCRLIATSAELRDMVINDERLKVYSVMHGCIKSIFMSHGGVLNANLGLWRSAVDAVFELAVKFLTEELGGCQVGSFIIELSCTVLEPFAKFLKVHPCHKGGFCDFVDNFLEPLLHLSDKLHDQCRSNSHLRIENLLKLVEEVLSYGLFHSVHIDEFMSLHSLEKFKTTPGETIKDSMTVVRSYHRHLFEKLEEIVSGKKLSPIGGVGELFRLFANQVKKQKIYSLKAEGSRGGIKSQSNTSLELSQSNNMALNDNKTLSSAMRKSILDFFVQIIEPLLYVKLQLHSELEMTSSLLSVHQALKAVNKMLVSLTLEEVYVRTEDVSEGACLNFFKVMYDVIMSFSAQIIQSCLSGCNSTGFQQKDLMVLVARELVVAISYLLDLGHEVMGDDIMNTWLVILSFLALRHQMEDTSEVRSLTSKTIDLGCQLVNIYSDLRQVSHAVFALSRGLRLLITDHKGLEIKLSGTLSLSSIHYEPIAKSARVLLCSRKFRQAVLGAVKNIPEGQASGCILTLADDLSDSLNWIKVGCSDSGVDPGKANPFQLGLRAEILGMVLSEVYTEVLDSLIITAGNSNLVGASVKNLLLVLRPSMSALVASERNGSGEFVFSVTGLPSGAHTTNVACWIILLFFRLYLSCRSLLRQAMSLMPPVSSRKMSSELGDSFVTYSGNEWMERSVPVDEGYFSWIKQPSRSLLDIINFVKNNFLQIMSADYSALIYVMYCMALQRVVDLNRLINSISYLLRRDINLDRRKLMGGKGSSRKWEKLKSVLSEEACGLTAFMVNEGKLLEKGSAETANGIFISDDQEHNSWNMVVCSVNGKTLPIAIWWIICRNVDTWGHWASGKSLKNFFSTLFSNALEHLGEQCIGNPIEMKVTIGQSSLELLRDTSFYELSYVHRYLASRFCLALKKCVLELSGDCGGIDGDFSSKPDWEKALSSLEDSNLRKCFMNEVSSSHISPQVVTCRKLLKFLGHMPKRSLSTKCFSLYAKSLLNLERFVVFGLLDTYGNSNLISQRELLSLFMYCRRALQSLVIAFCEESTDAKQSSSIPMFCKRSFPFLWLLKSMSAVVQKGKLLSGSRNTQYNDITTSLMNTTSYVFLTLSKYHFKNAVQFLINSEEVHENLKSRGVNACERVKAIAELLMNQTWSSNLSLKGSSEGTMEDNFTSVDFNQHSSLLLCLRGFLCGLASALDNVQAGSFKMISSMKSTHPTMMAINRCITAASKFMDLFLQMLLIDECQQTVSSIDAQGLMNLDYSGNPCTMKKFSDNENDFRSRNVCSISSDVVAELLSSPINNVGQAVAVLSGDETLFPERVRIGLLQGFLKGEDLDKAYILRELYIASSAIMRMNMLIKCTALSLGTLQTCTCSSQVLLMEFANIVQVPEGFSFVWLDGAVKFLEELGAKLAFSDPTKTGDLFSRIVTLHLRAIGRCISLQQKRATIASHERESSIKSLRSHTEAFKCSDSIELLKARLRQSLMMLIRNSSESQLTCAMQALEKALAGVQETPTVRYEIYVRSCDGGSVSSTVAAGVDCLDLIVELVSGQKRLNVMKRHMQNFVASLFNIVMHLQGPSVFYNSSASTGAILNPDPGSVVLMCVELLTKIFRKYGQFHMDTSCVAQSLRIPGALLDGFHNLKLRKEGSLLNHMDFTLQKDKGSVISGLVDSQFVINLYIGCCRLLCTCLRHHRSTCVHCIGLLQQSVEVLLNCLELAGADSVEKTGQFTWNLEEGVLCASHLRRVYEEIRQQRDALAPHCFLFLSTYISVYSGYGPLKKGLKREIEEALSPGVYALIDVCDNDDFQYMHTVFGEGPCRSTLANLRRGHKLNFRYEGKV